MMWIANSFCKIPKVYYRVEENLEESEVRNLIEVEETSDTADVAKIPEELASVESKVAQGRTEEAEVDTEA